MVVVYVMAVAGGCCLAVVVMMVMVVPSGMCKPTCLVLRHIIMMVVAYVMRQSERPGRQRLGSAGPSRWGAAGDASLKEDVITLKNRAADQWVWERRKGWVPPPGPSMLYLPPESTPVAMDPHRLIITIRKAQRHALVFFS